MINSANDISTNISMNRQKLEELTSFKYLGATLCTDNNCSAETCIKIVWTMTVIARLNRIGRSKTISLASKFKMHKANNWV